VRCEKKRAAQRLCGLIAESAGPRKSNVTERLNTAIMDRESEGIRNIFRTSWPKGMEKNAFSQNIKQSLGSPLPLPRPPQVRIKVRLPRLQRKLHHLGRHSCISKSSTKPSESAIGQGLPSRLRWVDGRFTSDSCGLAATPNSAESGQNRPPSLRAHRRRCTLAQRGLPAGRRAWTRRSELRLGPRPDQSSRPVALREP
jgi:hypothetical protein